MAVNTRCGGLDYFKLIAALLVVAIHTSPLATLNADADFILTRVIARVAVPFFLMVSGYFILPRYLFRHDNDKAPLLNFFKKTAALYALASLIYLPVSIYAGYFDQLTPIKLLQIIFFTGDFYHLWYLPGVIIGMGLVYLLSRRLSFSWIAAISLILYLIGILGDSYFGLVEQVPWLAAGYQGALELFGYTRNGLFYVPLFLVMGAWLQQRPNKLSRQSVIIGLLISLTLLIAEGLLLRSLGLPRHDSMYLSLIPCCFFLYQLLLSWEIEPAPRLRKLAMWIYLLHPLVIIAIRGLGEAISMTQLLVDNSIVHYLLVCLEAIILSVIVTTIPRPKRKDSFPRERAWIEIDLAHLRHNVAVLRSLLPDSCQLMPAVKADAYGLGAIPITQALAADDIHCFCVASLSEALELRQAKITADILILGYTHPDDFPLLKQYNLIQTVLDYHYAQELNASRLKLRVHLKIDTGMHRQGERDDNFNAIKAILAMESLQIEGMYTHLAMADSIKEQDIEYTQMQLAHFSTLIARLQAEGITIPALHVQSSYGIINYRQLNYNYARPGIALYGAIDSRHVLPGMMPDLKPVFALKTRISTIKELSPGEGAGYDLAYTAKSKRRIAMLTIGYADGIPRSLSEKKASVLVNGQRAPIIGKICMDQMMIDISKISQVRPNDIATIIGQDGQDSITAVDFATWDDTIANEILSRLGRRLVRIYHQ